MTIADLQPAEIAALVRADRDPPEQPAPLPTELTVVIPTLNERDNVAPLVERLNRSLAGHPLGGDLCRRRFTRRHRRCGARGRRGGRATSAACSGSGGAGCRRPASRASSPAHRRISRSWMATCSMTRRCCRACCARIKDEELDIVVASRHVADGVGRRLAAIAGRDQRFRHAAQPARRQGRAERPDERVLPGRAPRLYRGDAPPVGAGVQDPARPVRIDAAPASPLPRCRCNFRAASPRRKQARYAGRLGISDAAAAKADRPGGAGPLPAVFADRRTRRRDPSGDTVGRRCTCSASDLPWLRRQRPRSWR